MKVFKGDYVNPFEWWSWVFLGIGILLVATIPVAYLTNAQLSIGGLVLDRIEVMAVFTLEALVLFIMAWNNYYNPDTLERMTRGKP